MLSNFGGVDDFFEKIEIYFKGAELTIIILKFIQCGSVYCFLKYF